MSTGQQWWADKEADYSAYRADCARLGIEPKANNVNDYDIWEPHWRGLPVAPKAEVPPDALRTRECWMLFYPNGTPATQVSSITIQPGLTLDQAEAGFRWVRMVEAPDPKQTPKGTP